MRAFPSVLIAAAIAGSAALAGDRPVYTPVYVVDGGQIYQVLQDGTRVPTDLKFDYTVTNELDCAACEFGAPQEAGQSASAPRLGQTVAGIALPADAASRADLHARLLEEAKKRGLR